MLKTVGAATGGRDELSSALIAIDHGAEFGDIANHFEVKTMRLRPLLWNSLCYLKDKYDAADQELIGQILVLVHIGHTIKFGRLLRGEFVSCCIWNKSALWAEKWIEYYNTIGQSGEHIREAVESAVRHGMSPIRILTGEVPRDLWNETWFRDLWWNETEHEFGDHPAEWYLGDDQWSPGIVSPAEEEEINRSLLRLFGRK